MIFLALLVFFGILGIMGFMIYKALQMSDPKRFDSSANDKIETAQEFLPFETIKDATIHLGGHTYRAVLECSSTNYNLKTDKEKELIEVSFQRFLNSLTFPLVFFVQTKVIDYTKMLAEMKEEMAKVIKEFPMLETYANIYYQEMSNLPQTIGNTKQKKKYVIVGFDEARNMGELDDQEKYEYSLKELEQRVNIIKEGLATVGIKAERLSTEELCELIYSAYHKDNYLIVENIISGEYLTLLTEGENITNNLGPEALCDVILSETEKKLEHELINVADFSAYHAQAKEILDAIKTLRETKAGYYLEEYRKAKAKKEEEKSDA